MEYAQLGKTDLIVSRICFGCWQLSPLFWGEVPLGPWREAVHKAVDLGINFIDTAGAYGDGYSESCLGECLADGALRDELIVATKFYWNFQGEDRYPETTYEFVISETEDALRRMRIDHIDLLQIHSWDPLTRPGEVAAALERLKMDGKILWAGVSNMNVEQISLHNAHFEVASLQPWYNMIERSAEQRELPYCLEHRIGVIPYSPLYRGLLTGKYARDHVFDDDRANLKLYQGKAFERMLDALDEIKELADPLGLTVGQFAIRWVLTQPAITSAIVGIKDAKQVETIAAAANEDLPIDLWFKAGKIIETAKNEAEAMS